jgi:protocatechuate 3,4-dioxygenase beta subunit
MCGIRNFYFAWIWLVAAAVSAQQQAPPKRRDAPKQEACTIEGRVVNAVTGQPLGKAEIVLWRLGASADQRYTTTTAAGGRFAMQDIEPAKYLLRVSKRGYAHLQYGARGAGKPGAALSLDPGQHLSDLVLRMSPQAVIMGRVLDQDGDPVPNVGIQLLRYSFTRGKRQLQQLDDGGTNDLGEYRLYGLSPGKYYLSAAPNGGMGEQEYDSGQTYAPTYYPGTSNPSTAAAVELQPGTVVRGADITLVRTRTVRVRGRVVDLLTKGSPQPANVSLQARGNWEGMFWPSMASNGDLKGNFEIRGVVPGEYTIQAFKRGADGKNYIAMQPIDVHEANIDNIVLEFSPPGELKGRLSIEGRMLPANVDPQITLEPTVSSIGWGAGASVKADGSFTLSNVTPARYQVHTFGIPEDYYIKSVRLGDKDVLESGLDFPAGAGGALLIVVSSNGGQIEGVVLNADEQTVSAARVVLVPDESRRAQSRFYRDASTDQYGRFTIKGIAPGGYKLFAWEDVEDGAYENPEFLKQFEALGEPKSIREGSRESAQLKLIPAQTTKAVPAN